MFMRFETIELQRRLGSKSDIALSDPCTN